MSEIGGIACTDGNRFGSLCKFDCIETDLLMYREPNIDCS